MRSDGFAHFKIRFRNFELDFEPAPNGWIKQLRVICDADCETHVAPDVELMQKRIHYALDFANLLRVISNFGDRVNDRKRVVKGKSVSVRSDRGGDRCIKTTNKDTHKYTRIR